MSITEIINDIRAESVSRDLSKYNLIHTAFMIHYAEHPKLSDYEKRQGLLRTIKELELFYKQNKHDIPSDLEPFIMEPIKCATKHVLDNDYWSAIIGVHDVEVFYLRRYLPDLPNLEKEANAFILLAMRAAKKMGVEIIMNIEPDDPADSWKNKN